eukprot:Hpha_TRINITY_DN2702_c0_g1::TRINITY_DN2702_c0_g1_i1::g.110398::m.110398
MMMSRGLRILALCAVSLAAVAWVGIQLASTRSSGYEPNMVLALKAERDRLRAALQKMPKDGAVARPVQNSFEGSVCGSTKAWEGGCKGEHSESEPGATTEGACSCACLMREWCRVFTFTESRCTLFDHGCKPVVRPGSGAFVQRPKLVRARTQKPRFKCLLMYFAGDFIGKTKRRAMLEIAKHVADGCDETSAYLSVNGTLELDLDALELDLRASGVNLERLQLTHWKEEAKNLWEKEYTMWVRVWQRDLHRFEYFAKVEADTLFVGKNFRRWLRDNSGRLNPDIPNFYGPVAWARPPTPTILSNYVLNRGALEKMGPTLNAFRSAPRESGRTLDNPHGQNFDNFGDWLGCHEWETQAGDFEISRCLHTYGIGAGEANWDTVGREYFFSCTMDQRRHLPPDKTFWFWTGRPFHYTGPSMCCADFPIMTHLHKEHCRLLMQYRGIAAEPKEVSHDTIWRIEKGGPVPEWCKG